MAKLFPSIQQFIDLRNGDTIGITEVTILTATSDHVVLPVMVDAQLLQTNKATADPTFYITDSVNEGTAVAIDGATAGTEFIVVSRHQGQINFGLKDDGGDRSS